MSSSAGDAEAGAASRGISRLGGAISGAARSVRGKLNKGWEDYPEADGGKAGHVKYGCAEAVPKDAPYIHKLKHDLANSYYWTGGFFQDYFFFVANWHPFLGMLLSHPNHPWSKRERLAMFCISLAITMVPSAAIAAQLPGHRDATVVVFAWVTLPDIAVGLVLYQLSIADTRCPNSCGACMNLFKRFAMACSAFFALSVTGVCFLILRSRGAHWSQLLVPLVKGKLLSFLTWFPIWLLVPCQLGFIDLWCAERRAAQKAAGTKQQLGTMDSSESSEVPEVGQPVEVQA
uniref:Uncharacterized protein n=1 Tax=Alexandrium monilatum TaxID=311494 RepID=A0A7S4QAV2_9DINO